MPWGVVPAPTFGARLTEMQRISTVELRTMFSNLFRVQALLLEGSPINSLAALTDLVTAEPDGVFSVDQRGPSAQADSQNCLLGKLYFYPDDAAKAIHVITISQKVDTGEALACACAHAQLVKQGHNEAQVAVSAK